MAWTSIGLLVSFFLGMALASWLRGRREARNKDRFLAILSHELRNPLAPIRNGLFILEHAAAGSEQARRAVALIDRQSAHLTKLVDDLFDYSRVSMGRIQVKDDLLELNALARRVSDDHTTLLANNKVTFELQTCGHELWVKGDETRLSQAIGNLLQNAAKFTPAGGRAVLAVNASESGEQAVLRLHDTGIGMAPELLQRLFLPFSPGDTSLERTRGGLGLGLALARSLVHLQHGTLTARSEGIGKGCEFIVTLPVVNDVVSRVSTNEGRASFRGTPQAA